MLDIVSWKWRPQLPPYRSIYSGDTVNEHEAMISRNCTVPYRYTCVTDDPSGIDTRRIRVLPLQDDNLGAIPNPSNPRNPSCFRRLRIFHPQAEALFGRRIFSVDLDIAVVADLAPLVDRSEDFVMWGGQFIQPRVSRLYNWYNGSLMLLTAGTRAQVWNDFEPARSPGLANKAGCGGSDQGWIAFRLGQGEATFGQCDGVYSYRNHILPAGGALPQNARVVVFHGRLDPWSAEVQARHEWVRRAWRRV